MPEIRHLIMQGVFWCSVFASYHGAGKRFLLVIQLKTIMEVRSLYMTALNPFEVGKHNSMITGPAVLEVPLLFSTNPTSRVAGIRHMIEIVRFLVQGAFWCSKLHHIMEWGNSLCF